LDAAGGIALRVAPQAIPEADPLARVRGEMNAIAVEGDFAGPLLLIGRGAGRHATASAVATDLVEVALGGPVGAGGREDPLEVDDPGTPPPAGAPSAGGKEMNRS